MAISKKQKEKIMTSALEDQEEYHKIIKWLYENHPDVWSDWRMLINGM